MRAQGASNKILCNYFSISRALPALLGSSLTRNLCFWTKRKSSFLHKTFILSTLVSKLLSVGGSVPGFPLLAVFEICRRRCRNKKQKHDKLTKSHRRRSEIKSWGEAENKLYIPFFPLSAYEGRVIFEQALDRTEIGEKWKDTQRFHSEQAKISCLPECPLKKKN